MRMPVPARVLVAALLTSMLMPGPSLAQEHPAEPVDLPAGMQFPDAAIVPPEQDGIPWRVFGMFEGQPMLVGTQPGRPFDAVVAAVPGPDDGWAVVRVDPGRAPRGPTGRRRPTTGLVPGALVDGPDGLALTGVATWNEPAGRIPSPFSAGLVWTSRDGRVWARHELAGAAGGNVSMHLPVVAPRAGGGWIAAATVGPPGNDAPTRIAIMATGQDGAWRSVGDLEARWALRATSLTPFGEDGLLLVGRELACRTSDRGYVGEVGAQLRAWVSEDGGATWAPVDLTGAAVLEEPELAPRSPRRCPDAFGEINERFATRGSLVGAADGALVAMSADGARAAVTRDLRTWTVADLPGAIPEGSIGRGALAPVVLVAPDGGIALLSLEGRRNDLGLVARPGAQVLGWHTEDDGATWARLPDPKPLRLAESGATTPADQAADLDRLVPTAGATWLLERSDDTIERLRRSVSGPPEAWTPCVPVARGDCAFALVDELDLSGQDLSDVDLFAATIRGGDLTGADLTSADLRGATVNAPLTDAILDRVDAGGAVFLDDMSGVSLERADLRGATVPFELLASVPQDQLPGMTFRIPVAAVARPLLAGLDLRGSAFRSADPGAQGNLRDLDLRGADLRGARFGSVDLTGADLRRARLDGVSFFDVTCPDGEPVTEGAFGPAACRLGS